jgi:hypothetical protein
MLAHQSCADPPIQRTAMQGEKLFRSRWPKWAASPAYRRGGAARAAAAAAAAELTVDEAVAAALGGAGGAPAAAQLGKAAKAFVEGAADLALAKGIAGGSLTFYFLCSHAGACSTTGVCRVHFSRGHRGEAGVETCHAVAHLAALKPTHLARPSPPLESPFGISS